MVIVVDDGNSGGEAAAVAGFGTEERGGEGRGRGEGI